MVKFWAFSAASEELPNPECYCSEHCGERCQCGRMSRNPGRRARSRPVKTYPRRVVTAEGSRRDSLFVVFFPGPKAWEKLGLKTLRFCPLFRPFCVLNPLKSLGLP